MSLIVPRVNTYVPHPVHQASIYSYCILSAATLVESLRSDWPMGSPRPDNLELEPATQQL